MTEKQKLTVHDIFKFKGVRQLTEVRTDTAEEASACDAAGIDILVTVRENEKEVREAAPNTFLKIAVGVNDPKVACERDAISEAFDAMEKGADAIYTGMSCKVVAAMAREMIPVVGHVGFIPYCSTWVGGFKAVGKNADDALRVYKETLEYEDAGAIGVEMEIVPHRVAAEISKRVKICVISMGSGDGCDAQYLFSTDIIGTNRGHIPRHAKVYADLKTELDRIQKMRIDAYTAFSNDVSSGAYPESKHIINIKEEEYESFMRGLDR